MKIAMSKQVNIPTPYEGRSIAKHLGKCVLEYMKDEEHKREFMEWYRKKYGREYVFKS